MGLLGGLGGALGGFLTGGGPMGALLGGLGGLSDSSHQQQTSGYNLRPWDPNEAAAMQGAYQSLFGNQTTMDAKGRNAYIQNAAQSYFQPMQTQITEGLQQGMGMNAARNARSGMAGSSKASADDRATSLLGARQLADAAAKAQMYGNQDFYNYEQNRRANLGAAQSTISGLWNQRTGTSDRYQQTPSSPVGTGLTLGGMGLMMGSPAFSQGNNWLGSLFGGGGGGGYPGSSPQDYMQLGRR